MTSDAVSGAGRTPTRPVLAGPESAAEHIRNALMLLRTDLLLPLDWKPGDRIPRQSELYYVRLAIDAVQDRLRAALAAVEGER